jgi:hypothetical protein
MHIKISLLSEFKSHINLSPNDNFSKLEWLMLFLNNSYMIYIIRNPILLLGISAYGGGVFVSLFFDRRCSPDYFFRNVNKMVAWIPDNKKR